MICFIIILFYYFQIIALMCFLFDYIYVDWNEIYENYAKFIIF